MSKTCIRCKHRKPLTEFGRDRSKQDDLRIYCKACTREINRSPVAKAASKRYAGTEKAKRARRRYNKGGGWWRAYLLRVYGLTVEAYDGMMAGQAGCCKICRKPFFARPHLDHDHVHGRVRGLLCVKCNTGLGSFEDNPDLLQAAIRYLKEAPQNHF